MVRSLSTAAMATEWIPSSSFPDSFGGHCCRQLKIIEPLTNPTAHGGSSSDGFDVVISLLPGYGYSGNASRSC